jgi:hypothetical protein
LLQDLRFADATVVGIYLFLGVMAIVAIYRLVVDDDPDAPTRRRWFGFSWPSATPVPELGPSSAISTAEGTQRREKPED